MWGAIIGSAIGIGTGLAGSIISGDKAAKAAKKAEAVLASERQKNQARYDRLYNQDYTQTAEAQNLLNRTREEAQKYVQQAVGRSRVGGGSAEEVAAAIEKAGDMQANTASNIAAQGTQYKQNVENQYAARDAAIDQQYQNLYNQQAANNASAGSAAMQAGMGLVQAGMSGAFDNMFKAKSSLVKK